MDAAVANSTPTDPQRVIASPEVRRLVEGVVRRRVPERDVEDVVQTILCDALASDRAPEDEEQLRKWIVGITRHKVADFHRKGGKATHVELPEEIAEGEEPPLSAREWARWAEKQTEGDAEKKRTLDWMAREGGGEKLAHIAEEEKLPATQVRQRVSRMRRFMKQRWAAELAAVAAVLLLALIAWRLLREEDPIAVPKPVPEITDGPRVVEAQKLRDAAFQRCAAEAWQECLDGLDEARELDAAGDAADRVQEARKRATEALAEDAKNDDAVQEKKGPAPDTTADAKSPPTKEQTNNKKLAPPAPFTKPGPKNNVFPNPKKPSPKAPPKKPSPKKEPVPTQPQAPPQKSDFEGSLKNAPSDPPSQPPIQQQSAPPPPKKTKGFKSKK